MKRVLITGANSYIGTSFEAWLNRPCFIEQYQVKTIDMRKSDWIQSSFSGYDTVFHVAGIAHVDIGDVTEEQKKQYYKVNCDLAIQTAEKAKADGVKQFIYMSSIIIYGDGMSVKETRIISNNTKPQPSNFYGDSKWSAEQKLSVLASKDFYVAILRPPMIYGDGCKGNYQLLKKIALRSPVFPDYPNQRSVLFIDNLCEFVKELINHERSGVFFPQDLDYVRTSELVLKIASENGKKIILLRGFNGLINLLSYIPGKMGKMINKAFGSLVYEKDINASLSSFNDKSV